MSDIVEVSERENGQQIEVIHGQTLRVTLPEVRTAGFRWSLRTSCNQVAQVPSAKVTCKLPRRP
jgi:predicted secreted protein